jgi:hypothetical protein
MKKQLQEVAPRSARTVTPPASAVPAPGAVMSLDDLAGGDARSQHVEQSLERAVLPQPQVQEEEAPPKSDPVPAASPVAQPAKPATKMIATPIDAQLRLRVRELRGQYEISEAFVVETALRAFFADRPLAEVAADLRARGGRLRRSR